jgi:hypothetical protein
MGAPMEQLATITSRLDAHVADTRQLMQRDALRDHPASIVADQPFLTPRPPPAPPLFRHDPPRHPSVFAPPGGPAALGGRRPTIDHVVVIRAAGETTDFDRDAINMPMKMNVHAMGPNTEFRHWKNRFLDFLSLKAVYLIPQLAVREFGAYLDESAQSYAFALLRHAFVDNGRANQAVRCITAARPDCGAVVWEILCERLDARSFARSLALLDNIMLRQRPGQTVIETCTSCGSRSTTATRRAK